MTRSYNFRAARRVPRVVHPERDPSISRLWFRVYRLVEIDAPRPEDPPFESVELTFPPSVMAALAMRA